MNKVFLRKTSQGDKGGIVAAERLDINVEQEESFRHCSFSFHSQIQGIANIEGHISFMKTSPEPTALTHSSGTISRESMGNFTALDALLSRLETLCASGLTDKQILGDRQIRTILKANNFKSLEEVRVLS